jgi:fatty-acyl-CoA synthase
MMSFPLTLPHLLERAGRIFGHREIASRAENGSVTTTTYAQIYRRSRQLATALGDLGIRQGEAVATLAWNHSRHLEAYFGVPCSGAVIHTVNPRLSADDLVHVIKAAKDRAVIVDASLLSLVDALPEHVRPEFVIVIGETTRQRSDVLDYDRLLEGVKEIADYPDIAEDDAAAMCFTSATTGRPKGVSYSHRALVLHSVVSAMPDEFGISGNDVLMPIVPMFHVNAWGLPYTAALVGASLVLPGPMLDGDNLLDLIESRHVSFAAGVPTVWIRILESLRTAQRLHDLSQLRTVLIGGSAASASLIAEIDALGPQVLHAWGMTETTPLGSAARIKPGLSVSDDEQLRLRSTQGIVAPLVEMRSVADGSEVAHDGHTSGELEVRGPWVAGSYVGGQAPERFTEDGWFRTGDIVVIDPEGYMQIVDRSADLIKSGGEWISSLSLEAAIVEHPAVDQAAVIGVADATWAERPFAFVVTHGAVTADELRARLGQQFAKWQVPDHFEFVDALPLTATGKISKVHLREQIANRTPEEGNRS